MYEDSWYNFVPEITGKKSHASSQGHGHRRRESLLQQPNVCSPILAAHPTYATLKLTMIVAGNGSNCRHRRAHAKRLRGY